MPASWRGARYHPAGDGAGLPAVSSQLYITAYKPKALKIPFIGSRTPVHWLIMTRYTPGQPNHQNPTKPQKPSPAAGNGSPGCPRSDDLAPALPIAPPEPSWPRSSRRARLFFLTSLISRTYTNLTRFPLARARARRCLYYYFRVTLL